MASRGKSRDRRGRRDGRSKNDAFPWDSWLRTALGALQWRPAEFWRATLTEFFIAVDVYNERNAGPDDVAAPTSDEMADLLARFG
ncbi:MAG: phage tail assembly chaperone [Rhizobiales bacterium]|nr:phage tail assembly chaperone [Hyphomicrobiales bacterium]